MLLWLWLLVTAVGDCPEPITAQDLSNALIAGEDRAAKRDPNGFARDFEVIEQALPCLDTLLTPRAASRVHALSALQALLAGDEAATLSRFRAAREADPAAPRPGWLGDKGSVLELRYQASVPEAPTEWLSLQQPEGQRLYVDGVATAAVPDRPALLQALGEGDAVLWTQLWAPGDDLPEGFVVEDDQAEGAVAAGPPAAPDPGAAGPDALVQECSRLLAAGRFEDALRKSLPAVSTYPEYSATFQAIADIATGQLERRRAGASVQVQSNLPRSNRYSTPSSGNYRGFYPTREDWKRARRDLKGLRLGLDVGMPMGGRLEYKLAGAAVDSFDLRVGGNLNMVDFIYPYLAPEVSLAVDWNLGRSDWQIEMIHGLTIYYGVYPIFGGAIQYDPPTPLQVNFGFKVGGYAIIPDIGLSFLW